MKIKTIPKKSGGVRTIYVPNRKQKFELRIKAHRLNAVQQTYCGANVHGFIPGRSPVTNAMPHIGFKYTLCADLKDFFDSVKPTMLTRFHPTVEVDEKLEFPDGAARQGLPTSPALANLAATEMDKEIMTACVKFGVPVYTRYADDLSFSGNDRDAIMRLRFHLPTLVGVSGFTLNRKKTRLQWAGPDGDWSRIITGVAVGRSCIRPTRSVKRRLRAALHQQHQHQADGLAEWCRLKLPNPAGSPRLSKVQLAVARKVARMMRQAP